MTTETNSEVNTEVNTEVNAEVNNENTIKFEGILTSLASLRTHITIFKSL
jgi:hypothetical protein